MPRNALGKGLSALIREPEPSPQQQPAQGQEAVQPSPVPTRAQPVPTMRQAAATAAAPALAPADGLLHVDIDLIDPSPYQPRSRFREEALDELARSIQASGIVQPLVVRRVGSRHQLIAGERRWRAAQRAGLSRVPIVIRNVPDEMALEMTLVENLQREDLNPVEQAHAFQRLTEEFHLTQEEVAERTGKDRTTIANAVRLLKLEEPILILLEEGRLSSGHGRALLAIADSATRLAIAQRVARTGMTVRQVERLASRGPRSRAIPSINQPDPNTKAALEELQREYATRVLIQPRRSGKPGQLIFEYYDDSDLTRLYDQLMLK
jgi:ParB family transcriptional regulator, chromosome partitioning protein